MDENKLRGSPGVSKGDIRAPGKFNQPGGHSWERSFPDFSSFFLTTTSLLLKPLLQIMEVSLGPMTALKGRDVS